MNSIPEFSAEDFDACLRRGHGSIGSYEQASLPRLFRIAKKLSLSAEFISGPTLDVGSGSAVLYPFLKSYLPVCLPYTAVEPKACALRCAGDTIACLAWQCEKERLALADKDMGFVLLCDVLEHLIVDPIWTLLEINRILRPGGYLAVSTPNANSVDRVFRLLNGQIVATESQIKPTAIYDRHNREWNIPELIVALSGCGFEVREASTQFQLLNEKERTFLQIARREGWAQGADELFGPEIFCLALKKTHLTIDDVLPEEQRWPGWLYSGYQTYHTRPMVFPVRSVSECTKEGA